MEINTNNHLSNNNSNNNNSNKSNNKTQVHLELKTYLEVQMTIILKMMEVWVGLIWVLLVH